VAGTIDGHAVRVQDCNSGTPKENREEEERYATGWTTGVRFPAREGIFLFATTSTGSALRPIQSPVQ
jgi:hypothetical protein